MRPIIASLILTLALPAAGNVVKPDPARAAPTDTTKARAAAHRESDSSFESILRAHDATLSSRPRILAPQATGDADLERLKRVIERLRTSPSRQRPEGDLEQPVWYRIGSCTSRIEELPNVPS
jgi:hypothetical protein